MNRTSKKLGLAAPKQKKPAPSPPMAPAGGRKRNKRRRGIPVPGPNQGEVMMPIARTKYGLTAAGRAWLRNYLNPCGEKEVPCTGIPDGTSSETAIVNSNVEQDIAPPADLVSGDTSSDKNWFLGIFIPPWVEDCAFLVAADHQPTQLGNLTSITEAASPYPAWQSVGTDPNKIYYCRLPNQSFQYTNEDESGNTVNFATSFRNLKRGITASLISDTMHDRGMITAGQWLAAPSWAIARGTTDIYGGTDASSTTTSIKSTVAKDVALLRTFMVGNPEPNTMTAANTRCYQGQAREGCYMPVYFSGNLLDYLPYVKRRVVLSAYNDNMDNEVDVTSTGSSWPSKICTESQNVGVIWFSGISVASSVRIKGRHTIQAIIQPESGWSAFARISDGDDALAIDQAKHIQVRLPQAYPACYNDWGWLGKIVKGLIGKIPYAGGVLSSLVDPLGKALGGLFGGG